MPRFENLAPPLEVVVSTPTTTFHSGEKIRLRIKATNVSSDPLFLVKLRRVQSHRGRIDIELGETEPTGIFLPYWYTFPELIPLTAGMQRLSKVTVALPITRDRIGRKGKVIEEAIDIHGPVQLQVRMGFLRSDLRQGDGDGLAVFLSKQEHSKPITIPIVIK